MDADEIRDDAAPPEREEGDEPHYDALERTGFFGEQGAGAILIAADTGRMLLVERSPKVEQPGTWGNMGGAHHADEDPDVAALREIREESGWQGAILAMIAAFVFTKGSFVYRNFVAVVPREFVPQLGWEAVDHRWCGLDDLPEPLHFGVEALLADPESRDIVEGGWRDCVDHSVHAEMPDMATFSKATPLEAEAASSVGAEIMRIMGSMATLAPMTLRVEPMRGTPEHVGPGGGGTDLIWPFDPSERFDVTIESHPRAQDKD
jgi:8-oxo-dGTP pyrophosphatase MutT (NUDIX family)